MQQIARGIYFDDSYLGVTLGGLIYSHGVILIDAPLRAEDARSWRSSLMNQRGGMNRLLINLDAHPDRTLGSRALDCTVVAHQKTAQVFRNRPTLFKGQSMESGSMWETYTDAIGMRWATPDITFTHQMSLHWGGPEILLEHHPAQTPGAIWVVIPAEKVVFAGDAVVVDQPPFLAHADLPAWIETLERLQTGYGDYVVIAGRGGLAVPDSVRTLHHFLKEAAKGIERLARRGAAPEETEELIPGLLHQFQFPGEYEDRYAKRLRYGLLSYYTRRYRPSSALDQPRQEDGEQ